MCTCALSVSLCTTQYPHLTGIVWLAGEEELGPTDLEDGVDYIVEYGTTQRVSKSGSRQRHIKVLRAGTLSETDYYKPHYGDAPGVWVEDKSDGGKEKFFVHSRFISIRTVTLDDLL